MTVACPQTRVRRDRWQRPLAAHAQRPDASVTSFALSLGAHVSQGGAQKASRVPWRAPAQGPSPENTVRNPCGLGGTGEQDTGPCPWEAELGGPHTPGTTQHLHTAGAASQRDRTPPRLTMALLGEAETRAAVRACPCQPETGRARARRRALLSREHLCLPAEFTPIADGLPKVKKRDKMPTQSA